jgi:hypothetical protein
LVSVAPLLTANPVATLAQRSDQTQLLQEWALPPLDMQQTQQDLRPWELTNKANYAWFSNDYARLAEWALRSTGEQLGAKLLYYLPRWKETCGEETFIALGMLLYWVDPVIAEKECADAKILNATRFKSDVEKEAFAKLLWEEITEGTVIPIDFADARYISPSSVVPKKNPGEWRKILDLRFVNARQQDIQFRMEGPETVQQLMVKDDWMTSLDLRNAFNHIPVHPSLVPYLAFAFQGRCFTYRAVPFGAKHGTRVSTLALGLAVKYARLHWSVKTVVYMDDLLIMHADPTYLREATVQICVFLRFLGWTIATEKCEFTPAQRIEYLGWRWCSRTLTLTMTPAMQSALRKFVQSALRAVERRESWPCRRLGRLIGSLNFLRAQLPRASLFLRLSHVALTDAVNRTG